MKMLWNRIKYHLLRWLLDDICEKSKRDCDGCLMRTPIKFADYEGIGCEEMDILYQASKVWRIGR